MFKDHFFAFFAAIVNQKQKKNKKKDKRYKYI